MRRLFCIALLALVLTGCGASRRSMKSDTKAATETSAEMHTEASAAVSEQSTTHTDLSKDVKVTTEIREYDTTLPINSATGTPPVKRIITQTSHSTTKALQDVVTERQDTLQTRISAATAAKSETAVVTEEESDRGMNWWQTTLCTIGAAAILGLLLWVVVRRFKRW